jgi:hypothetical protein
VPALVHDAQLAEVLNLVRRVQSHGEQSCHVLHGHRRVYTCGWVHVRANAETTHGSRAYAPDTSGAHAPLTIC